MLDSSKSKSERTTSSLSTGPVLGISNPGAYLKWFYSAGLRVKRCNSSHYMMKMFAAFLPQPHRRRDDKKDQYIEK